MRRVALQLLVTTAAMMGYIPNDASATTLSAHSPAVALALAHIDAWSHHDWDKARQVLAADVHVTVTSTQSGMNKTDTTGIDAYMDGLKKFAQAVAPGERSRDFKYRRRA